MMNNNNDTKCSSCNHEFKYNDVPESGMGCVKCPNCGKPVTQINEAPMQAQRHALGRMGEKLAMLYLGGELTSHKSPFDLIDWSRGRAYEIKTIHSGSMDQTIRIKPPSLRKKLDFAEKYNLEIVLIVVVIYDQETEIYGSKLRTSVKPKWMKLLKKKGQTMFRRERASIAQLTEEEDISIDRLPTLEDFLEDEIGNGLIIEYEERIKG